VTATLALFVALSGGAYAVGIPKRSVGTKQLKHRAVTTKKLAPNAVTGRKVADGSLRAGDFATGDLPRGPRGATGAPGAAGSPGISGFEIVFDASVVDSSTQKAATATCPPGKRVIGGFGTLVGAGPTAPPAALALSATDEISGNRWRALGTETTPVATDWFVRASAVCARVLR
jgi:hypothetical protein